MTKNKKSASIDKCNFVSTTQCFLCYMYYILFFYRLCYIDGHAFFRKYALHTHTNTHTIRDHMTFRDRARLAHVRDWQKFISCDLHVARKLRVWCAFAAWGLLFRWQGLSSVLSALSWVVVVRSRQNTRMAWEGWLSKTTAGILGTDARRPSRLLTILIIPEVLINPCSENPRCSNNRLWWVFYFP